MAYCYGMMTGMMDMAMLPMPLRERAPRTPAGI